jgi:hypothetical protein
VPYLDRITGKNIAPITSGQIYWGAVPFVCIQILMIGLTIMFPQMVMHYKGPTVEPSDVEIVVPGFGGSQDGQPGGLPPLGLPPIGGQQGGGVTAPPPVDLSKPPSFGEPAPQAAPPANQGIDLSQPPSFGETAPPAAPAPATQPPDLSQPPSFD